MGGTKKGYEGLGLQQRIRSRVFELALERGFDRMVAETINPATQHIWEKMGGEKLASRPLSEGKVPDGSQPFPNLAIDFTVQEKVLRKRPIRDSFIVKAIVSKIFIFHSKKWSNKPCTQGIFKFGCLVCCCN